MLIGENISKSFGSKTILEDISLTVRPGEITALIGPSGTGKTTLLRALSLLDPPQTGTIAVDDTTYSFPDNENSNIAPPWPRLTVVFQQLFLWPHLTIRENIVLPLSGRTADYVEEKLNSLVTTFEMQDFLDNYPNQASLGQRQRAALARAIALEPAYLLLDEVTSALDVEQVSVVLDLLQKLRDEGTAVFLVTHLIGFARKAANQVLFMDHGGIAEAGGPEILASPRTERLARFLSLVHAEVSADAAAKEEE